jgi:hypothetical protein
VEQQPPIFVNLLKTGVGNYKPGIDTLRTEVKRLVENGKLGYKKYDQPSNNFVPI